MTLYHGSNTVFTTPLLAKCSPHKDFGQGPDHNRDRRYDWVVGPIADDGLAFLFRMFERGYYTLGEVLRRMRFGRQLTTQYSFHTRAALSLLVFKEASSCLTFKSR